MSSHVYAHPLRFERHTSSSLLTALMVVHGLALSVTPLLPVAWWLKVPLALAIALQWRVGWRRQVSLTSPSAVTGMVWTGGDNWELSGGDGAIRQARLLPGCYVHPRLVVLRFAAEDGHARAAVLPADGLDPDSHRRLRVQLQLLQERAAADD